MKFGAKKTPTVLAGGSRFAPNFIQNLYTVLKKRLWKSRSTPTLVLLSNRREMYPDLDPHLGPPFGTPIWDPHQGDIVGREYIHSCKFISPYGTSLGDSTITQLFLCHLVDSITLC
jgi:hypothetical protein